MVKTQIKPSKRLEMLTMQGLRYLPLEILNHLFFLLLNKVKTQKFSAKEQWFSPSSAQPPVSRPPVAPQGNFQWVKASTDSRVKMGTALWQIHTLPVVTCDWQNALRKCKQSDENNAALEVRTIQSPGCQLGQKLSFSTHPNTIKIKASFQVNSLGGAPQYTSPSFYLPFRRKISFFLQDVYSAAWLTASGRSARTQIFLFSSDLSCHHHKITFSLNHVLACFSRNLFQPWNNV